VIHTLSTSSHIAYLPTLSYVFGTECYCETDRSDGTGNTCKCRIYKDRVHKRCL